jgi:predicted O-linked N-acetylglucosamine transferase (SPINDLY family)
MLPAMDETTINELRELAEKNGIDPDRLLEIAQADGLPEELGAAMADILGDLTIFGQALDEKDR